MSTKPRNLKKLIISDDGSLHCHSPFVRYENDRVVELDGYFGIKDLEWIIKKMKNDMDKRNE
jgi:hypothetical protein